MHDVESEAVRLLRERAVELEKELEMYRAAMKPLQEELRQVDAGIRAMTGELIAAKGAEASERAVAHFARLANVGSDKLTIKELVVRALGAAFDEGATTNELLGCFSRQYGRDDIVRTSLSPQLSRLKDEGKIERFGKCWRLANNSNGLAKAQDAGPNADDRDEGAATPSHPIFDL